MTETQKSISDWANQTFGKPRDNLSTANRAKKEMIELCNLLEQNDNHPKVIVEAADVIIVLMRLFECMGASYTDEIDKKMAINRKRKWSLDGNGHGQHIEE